MSAKLEGLDAWFPHEPAICTVTCAAGRLREWLAPLKLQDLFLVDANGQVVAREHLADTGADASDAEMRRAWLELSHLSPGEWHAWTGRSLPRGFRITLPGTDHQLVGAGDTLASVPELSPHLAMVTTAGLALQNAYEKAAELAQLRTRVRQLEAEKETLRESHLEATSTAIEEHENRLRERTQYSQALEAEVERRSRELVAARRTADDANRAKSEFLANMSHEIRTPMTAILGYTDMLIEEHAADAGTLQLLSIIKRNGSNLADIINDILDLSKIESGTFDVEQVAVSPWQLASEVRELMALRAEQKGIELRLVPLGALPESCTTDPKRLRQVLINLVGNAIKFTHRGAVHFHVGCGRTALGDYELSYSVRDSGIGIPREKLDGIFEPFQQADGTTSRHFGGTGLGLTISRRLVQMLGGRIDVESERGSGSTFTVRLPCGPLQGVGWIDPFAAERPVNGLLDAEVSQLPNLAACHVLLAEDGMDNQRLIAHVLRSANADVTVVNNGQEAIDAIETHRGKPGDFDVIMLDMQMPQLDGYAAARWLRSSGESRPIIALTAHAMTGDMQKCLEAGCDDYDSKPIDRRRLLHKVESAWRRRQSSLAAARNEVIAVPSASMH